MGLDDAHCDVHLSLVLWRGGFIIIFMNIYANGEMIILPLLNNCRFYVRSSLQHNILNLTPYV